jgi:hypothetical protein
MYKNGEIARLYFLKFGGVQQKFKEIFCPDFRDPSVLKGFLGSKIRDSIEGNLNRWSVGHFQAYFMLCWLHHPSEKGSYMIDLRNVDVEKLSNVVERLDARETRVFGKVLIPGSSHFSRRAYSASQGWGFLNHYNELLVQIEEIRGRPFLFLKAEGHKTDGFDAIQHCLSLFVKRSPSKELHAIAVDGYVSKRVAENYTSSLLSRATSYETLLSKLKLKGKFVTVLEMVEALCGRLGTELPKVITGNTSVTKSEQHLSTALRNIVKADKVLGILVDKIGLDREDAEEVREDFLRIADQLEGSDPDFASTRVFCEVQVTPQELESTYQNVLRIIDENLRSAAAA